MSGLALGVNVVLYDGSPKYPDLSALWKLIEDERITYFGTNAPYLLACQKQGLEPGKNCNLRSLRAIGSTGAPIEAWDDDGNAVWDQVGELVAELAKEFREEGR